MAATERRRSIAVLATLLATMLATVLCASAALGSAGSARADDTVSAGVTYAADDDGLIVVHPSASGRVAIDEDTRLALDYEADVISAATVDVRTGASVRPFEETRHAGAIGLDRALDRLLSLGGTVSLSHSPDYTSGGVGLRLRAEDDSRTHTLGLQLGGSFDSIGRVGDPHPVGEALGLGIGGSWSVLLGPSAVLDLALALDHRRGLMESPYRFVTVVGTPTSQIRVAEEVPDERWRGAASGGLRWALTDALFVRGAYRFHIDDWGLLGHTVDVEGRAELAPGLTVGLFGRVLAQRGASFYSGRYATLPQVPVYRTRDRTLSPHWSMSAGADVRVPLGRVEGIELSLRVRGRITWHRYFDTPLLPERTTYSAGLTLSAER